MKRSREYLKGRFRNGMKPTENDFGDSFDSYVHKDDDYQTSIADLEQIREGAAAGATAYQKPATGIPAADLSEDVKSNFVTAQEKQTWDGKQDKLTRMGGNTKPVYVSQDGVLSECNTYAGGTKVTLNGTDKGGSTASAYAPTTVGNDGNVLRSSGSGEPSWETPDTQPVENSTKLITSGAVYASESANTNAINEINEKIPSEASSSNKLYVKPGGGIPSTDLDSAVQSSLGKADTALQSESDPVFTGSVAHGITQNDVDAWNGKQPKVIAKGSTTKPVYVSSDGVFAECSTYAGGTKTTLNGTDRGGWWHYSLRFNNCRNEWSDTSFKWIR
jgi:hypothetical protein